MTWVRAFFTPLLVDWGFVVSTSEIGQEAVNTR